ncbi:MAG: RNA-binding cell elongation regulator Jag/EloR [Bacilli bacterium]
MEVRTYEGKNKEEVLKNIFEELNCSEKDILYKVEEKKGGLFKSSSVKIKVMTQEDIANYLKEYLNELLKNMNIECSFESKIRDEQITIKMFSNKNSILIGKNGQTLKALQTILRQVIYKELDVYPYIILDVEDYKEKKDKNLERLAHRIAKEVRQTGVEVAMENMNSYERRIVHNALSKYEDISTNSEGEEPNRHIIVKLKK